MSRTAKQISYGMFYLAILALILVSVAPFGVQEEESPAPVSTAARQLEVRGEVTVMTAADGSVAFLGRVWNPNATYVASSFPYSFRIMRGDVVVMETPRRTGFVYPSEAVSLLEIVSSPTFAEDSSAVLDIGTPDWESSEFLVRPTLVVSRAETSSDELGVVVSGEVRNMGAVSATTVWIIAFMKDTNGFPLFAAQTLLENISGGSFRSFFIRFPRDRGISERAAPDGTEIIVEAH
ncbi:MAG: hypothetical protein V1885_02005 [Candidatus Brennerbacteria bacterium]